MSTPIDSRWWTDENEANRHDAILRIVRHIRQNQEYRKVSDLLHASLYGNVPLLGFGIGSAFQRRATTTARLSLNVVRNMVGAVTSKIASKNKPKASFITEGGNADLRDKAEKLEKFTGGVFYESGVYAQLPKCFRDACVYGTCFLKVYEDGEKVCVDRVMPREIVVDDGEAMRGPEHVRNLYQRTYYDKLVLQSLAKDWIEDEEKLKAALAAIDASKGDPDDAEYAYQTTAEQVLVTEAWHLGETEKTKGRRCIVIDGATLLDEEWEGGFPFAVMRWSEQVAGYFGVGLSEELIGIQNEINKLLLQIQRGHHLIAGHWFVEAGSKVTAAQINNDLATILKYAGTVPQYIAPVAISPDVYEHLWNLYAKAFEISGISQLNATGQRPVGLNSGAAQRTYQDIQTERFLEVGQAYEEFVIEAARQVVRCAKRIGGSYRVRSIENQSMEFIDWSDIDLSEDLYVIRVYPTSLLPTTPSGKIEWAQEMQKLGMDADDLFEVLNMPDTSAYTRRRLAPRRIIERNIGNILKKGEANTAEPFDNHALALRLINEAYAEARLDGVSEEKLELLRRYSADTEAYLQKAAPPPPPMAPPGPPAPPMGPPMNGVPPMPPPMPPPMSAAA